MRYCNTFSRYFFILVFLFGTLVSGYGQSTGKSAFKKIEFVSYDYNHEWSEIKNKADISYYLTIDEKGNIKSQAGTSSKTIYTTIIPAGRLKQIADFLAANKKLSDYKIKEALEENTYYAGGFSYFSVTYANNTKQSICFIPSFMSDSFNHFIDQLPDIESDEFKGPPAKELITAALTNTITELHKKSKLPEFKAPPPAAQ